MESKKSIKSMSEKTISKTIFSNKLSAPLKDDMKSVFANVVRTQWEAPDGNIVYFVRLEFKLFRGENATPITVTFTQTQFDWLMSCFENAKNSEIVPGEREGKYI